MGPSCPVTLISSELGGSWPDRSRAKADSPAPFGPQIATPRPGSRQGQSVKGLDAGVCAGHASGDERCVRSPCRPFCEASALLIADLILPTRLG